MEDSSLSTTQLKDWLQRWRNGDLQARDQLIMKVCRRLERLARKMLRQYPAVGRWEETDDVLQSSLLRLMNSLQEIEPGSVREFYGLAALQIRRELLDLCRSHNARPDRARRVPEPAEEGNENEPVDKNTEEADLDQWTAFHEAVGQLSGEEREVVSLVFYHGKTQAEVAEIFGVNERTVRRWWQSACIKVAKEVRGGLPRPE